MMKPSSPTAPGTVSSAIAAIALGAIVAFCGTMWHASIWYLSQTVYIPWGTLLALLMTCMATIWLCLHTQRTWTGGLMGVTIFAIITYFAFGRAHDQSVLVLMNTDLPIGVAGTLWGLGSLFCVTLGIIIAAKSHARNRARAPRI